MPGCQNMMVGGHHLSGQSVWRGAGLLMMISSGGTEQGRGIELRGGRRHGQCCMHRVECFVLCRSVPCLVSVL